MKGTRKTTLLRVLRSATKRNLEVGWLYLKDTSTPGTNSECLIVADFDSEYSPDEIAEFEGFVGEGLHTETLEGIATCAAKFAKNPISPSASLLVESFVYYWRFGDWLPMPGAPDPPQGKEARLIEERSFYDSLGEERSDSPCKAAVCSRGAVSQSFFCRRHHFEMMREIPCPFSH